VIPAARQRLAVWQHALAVGALCVATLLRFYPAVTSTAPLGDEMAQEKAFLQEAAGRSPYLDGNYVYPPSLLRIGALLRQLPLPSPYLPLRGASILGLALLVWYATGRLGWKPWQRFGVAALYVLLAPGVRQGIEFGNLSFAVGGGILLALLAWERFPIGSGLLLGASLLVKPLAPAALVALFFHRPHRPHLRVFGGYRHQLAAGVAALAAAVPLLADPEFGAFLRHGSHAWVLERTVSLHRFLALAGLPGGASLLSLLLLAGVAAVARTRVAHREQLVAFALAGCVMVAPVVWNHTLVLTLPLQAMAVALAAERCRAAGAEERRSRAWEATGVALAVAALTFAEGATGIDDRGVALQIFATIPPALAPALLASYVLRFRDPAVPATGAV
jgi:hypothetical protein